MKFRAFDELNFTVIFNPETSVTNLKVPARVSAALQNQALEKSITLRNKYNNMWPVRAGKVDGHWYFQDGWTNFLIDSSVIANDRLKFIFSGEDMFDVKIIGSDGSLKEGVGCLKINNSKEHQNTECDQREDVDVLDRASYGKNKNLKNDNSIKAMSKLGKRGFKFPTDDSDEFEMEDDFAYDGCYWDGKGEDETKEVANELKKSMKNGNNTSGYIKRRQKRRDSCCIIKGILKSGLGSKSKSLNSVRKKVTWKKEEEEDSQEGLIKLSPRNVLNGKRRVVEVRAKERTSKPSKGLKRLGYLGNQLFESGVIRRPKWKYFVKKVNPKRMNELYIPKDILLDENLKLLKVITLVAPDGDIYTSRLKKWSDNRRIYKGGMNRLCRVNRLKKDDICICEFKKKEKPGFLYLSFLRKAD